MTAKLAIQGGRPVRTKVFPSWPVHDKSDERAVAAVVRSGQWWLHGGRCVNQFEKTFARYHGAAYGIAVPNGTVSLRIALLAAQIGEGDEVIVPPYTFLATATAVVEANALPVFVDIDPDTYNLDPARIEAAITPRTRAIIPVHFGGLPADMDRIMRVARRHGLTVIEDAAHAHGAVYKGRKVGAIGHLGSFSFQASKNLTCGEGGIITTNDPALSDLCRSIHDCGRDPAGLWYGHVRFGNNYRMSELQGALLLSQMTRLESQARRRDANGRRLDEGLRRIPGIRPLLRGANTTRHAYHLYVFRYDPAGFDGLPREAFLRAVQAEGVPCSPGYKLPLYRQEVFLKRRFGPYTGYRHGRRRLDFARCNCPVTEHACSAEACWLSQNVLLGTQRDMDDIVAAVSKVHEHRRELAHDARGDDPAPRARDAARVRNGRLASALKRK